MAGEAHPDVALVDIQMPVMDGIEATRRMTSLPGPPKVIILTTFDLDEYVFAAVRAGASAFLLKDIARQQLVDAVRRVHAGDALVAPTITRRLLETFLEERVDPATARAVAGLSERETDVLRRLARGMSNSEIAEDLFLGASTVKTHVAHVLAKLGVRDRVQAVIAAYESGLIKPGTRDST
jgi:DNA-binding NarL/FixJ family response regulator